MQQVPPRSRNVGPALAGLLLIGIGIAVLGLQQLGVDLAREVRGAGWPFLVIVPGIALLLAAAVPTPPRGIGFAIAGSIVTTVGLLLLYQSRTGDWQSWAYLWALIPLAAGVALLAYGSLAGERGMVTAGFWVGGTAAIVLVVSVWFFGGVFGEGTSVLLASSWWSVLLIALGAMLVLRTLLGARTDAPRG